LSVLSGATSSLVFVGVMALTMVLYDRMQSGDSNDG
jgi:hypothetical protein